MNTEEILKIAKEQEVRFIRLQFTDIFGSLKNVAITPSQLEKALKNQCMFDGSSIQGFARIEESDMYLRPDPDSFLIFPWSTEPGKVARLICDVYKTDGTPFEGDPRYILKKVLKEAEAMGYTCNIGPELEFFLFNTNEDGSPSVRTNDKMGYFDIAPMDMGSVCRREISLALEEMGFEIEASHHECGKAQHEIDFKYGEALITADRIMTFKLAVKSLAITKGLSATFMPKPVRDDAGSGMHMNISLMKDGVNCFCDENDKLGLSKTAYYFIGGIMEHAMGLTAVTNPLVNSYKRLVPGYEAPVYVAWSASNRSPLIRIPAARKASTRVEIRHPDPSCNPYLSIACAIAAGLDGIKRKLLPPKSVDLNIYEMTDSDRKGQGIKKLPHNLLEAVNYLQEDECLMNVLGEHTGNIYINAKKKEYRDYSRNVSDWEIRHYLSKY